MWQSFQPWLFRLTSHVESVALYFTADLSARFVAKVKGILSLLIWLLISSIEYRQPWRAQLNAHCAGELSARTNSRPLPPWMTTPPLTPLPIFRTANGTSKSATHASINASQCFFIAQCVLLLTPARALAILAIAFKLTNFVYDLRYLAQTGPTLRHQEMVARFEQKSEVIL